MDYLIVSIASLVLPYALSLAGVHYVANVGIQGSLQKFNKYQAELLYDKDKQYYEVVDVTLTQYRGYGVRPDFFAEFMIKKGRVFLAPTFGLEPFTTGIQIKMHKEGADPRKFENEQLDLYKGPYAGLKLGVDVKHGQEYTAGWKGLTIAPYVFAGIMRISKENDSEFQSAQVRSWSPTFAAGVMFKPKGRWAAYSQVRYLSFDSKSTNLPRSVSMSEIQFQLGVSYAIWNNEETDKQSKDSTYSNILNQLSTSGSVDNKKDSQKRNVSKQISDSNKKLADDKNASLKNTQQKPQQEFDFNF